MQKKDMPGLMAMINKFLRERYTIMGITEPVHHDNIAQWVYNRMPDNMLLVDVGPTFALVFQEWCTYTLNTPFAQPITSKEAIELYNQIIQSVYEAIEFHVKQSKDQSLLFNGHSVQCVTLEPGDGIMSAGDSILGVCITDGEFEVLFASANFGTKDMALRDNPHLEFIDYIHILEACEKVVNEKGPIVSIMVSDRLISYREIDLPEQETVRIGVDSQLGDLYIDWEHGCSIPRSEACLQMDESIYWYAPLEALQNLTDRELVKYVIENE